MFSKAVLSTIIWSTVTFIALRALEKRVPAVAKVTNL